MLLFMNSVGLVECVGFIDVLVIGIEIRWISVRYSLIVIGVKLVGILCLLVVLRIMNRKKFVIMIL